MSLLGLVRSGHGRRGRRARAHRISTIGQLAGLAILATVAVSPSQAADAAKDTVVSGAPAAPKTPSVTVHPVPVKRAALKDQTSSNHWKGSPAAWPTADTAVAQLPDQTTATARDAKTPRLSKQETRAGKTPVWLGRAQNAKPGAMSKSSPKQATDVRVTVQMRDHAAAVKAGVNGVLFTAAPTGTTDPNGVAVSVDYSAFKDAYGGDWSARLHLVQLPACALTTPDKPQCRVQTPLADGSNDPAAERVSGRITLPRAPEQPVESANLASSTKTASQASFSALAAPATTQNSAASGMMVLAATAGTSGGAGDYSATPLSPTGSWSAGASSGDYSYSYPVSLPPTPGGLVPNLSLGYDSQSVDGRLSSTNSQASWVGDGWSMESGSVTRSYMACTDDPAGTAPKTQDECWSGQILHVSFAGHSGDIVQDSSAPTGWKLSDDDNSKVEQLTSAGQNDTYDGDYWKITTTDGTQYYFGRNKLPGYTGTTNSAWTVPVYGAHVGDPCYNATFSSASCAQGWQWNLDEVVDVHGNAIAYYYNKETNYYGANKGTTGVSYTRGGVLDHIDYGLGNGAVTAPQRVTFTTADRCTATACDPIATNKANWPDVPYDLNCDSGTSCVNHGPSFWGTRRLTTITVGAYNATTKAYPAVDTYALAQSFPDPGDNTKPALWLNSITHTGNTGTAISLPAVTFTGIKLANRYNTSNGYPDLVRYRISGIITESGDATSISYSPASCATPADPSTNTGRCFPVYWTPAGQPAPILDWFNKYVVNSVSDNDTTGGSPGTVTSYSYLGNPAWHYDNNEIVKAKYRTYGQWRGYPEVQARSGSVSDGQTLTDTLYYQGMDGDTLPGGKTRSANVALSSAVTVPGAQITVPDNGLLGGRARESITYKGSGGPIVSASVNDYWISAATATRARSGLPDLTAQRVRSAATYTTQAITSGASTTWRSTQAQSAYDKTTGLLLYTDNHGGSTSASQVTCTSTNYAPANAGANLIGLAAEVETDAGPCGTGSTTTSNGLTAPTGVNRPTDVISDSRTFYDTNPTGWPAALPSWPQPAPTVGDANVVQQASDYTNGAFVYASKGATAYDVWGRPITTWDALGNKTSTAFTTTGGQTTSQKVTNAKGQGVTTTLDPTRGLPTAVVDANGAKTETAYDALGRDTAIWLAGRDRATQSADYTFGYLISATAPSAITTKKLNQDNSYTTSVALFDALLRSRQTQAQTPTGGRLLTDTFYDSRGWAYKKNGAYWDGAQGPSATLVETTDPQVTNQDLITFDGLGRPIADASQYKGSIVSQTRTIYGGDRTTVIPAAGGTPTTTITDALGRTIETDAYSAMPVVSGDRVTGGNALATTFTYDTAGSHGQLASIKDPGGNQRSYSYDLLGQKISQSDPDTGITKLAYDANGRVKSTKGATGKTVSVTYDALGRKIAAYDGADDTSTQLASWTYDDPKVANSIGRPTSNTRFDGGAAYTQATTGYTANGQPTGSSVTIPSTVAGLAGTYTYTNTYTTVTGLPFSTSYPAAGTLPAEKVTYGYNALDEVTAVGGLASYTSSTTYDAYARVTQMTVGRLANRNSFTNTYDEHTGALNEVNSTRVTAPQSVDDTTYTRDPGGNITRITDVQGGTTTDTQCYGYDLLKRLNEAWTATDKCAGSPSASGATPTVGGPNAYWTSWAFDADGNRTDQVQHAISGNVGDTTTHYTYGQGTDPSEQPDTLTSSKTTNPDRSTTSVAYGYDAAGHTTSTPTATNLTWNSEGNLDGLTTAGKPGSTKYLYDAAGLQLIRTDPNGDKTLFLPSQEVVYHAADATVTGTRSVSLPGGVTAERYGSANSYGFVLNNDQGTGTVGLDYTGQAASYRLLNPYGGSRGATPSAWHDTKGLVGGTQDSGTGLTNLGAREYDPTTGRFLSADPILEANDPNQIGGYSYAGDSPVTRSDPSGLRPDDCAMTGFDCSDAHGGLQITDPEGEVVDYKTGHTVSYTTPPHTCGFGGCNHDDWGDSHNFAQRHHIWSQTRNKYYDGYWDSHRKITPVNPQGGGQGCIYAMGMNYGCQQPTSQSTITVSLGCGSGDVLCRVRQEELNAGLMTGMTGGSMGDFGALSSHMGAPEGTRRTAPAPEVPSEEYNWPPNRGALGDSSSVSLAPGTLIDRYGYDGGTFVSPAGIPYSSRALPEVSKSAPYTVFRVMKAIDAQKATVAPWFGEAGMGTQYELSDRVGNLVRDGYLEKVTP